MRSGTRFKRVEKGGRQTAAPMVRIHPQLLELAAVTPSASHRATQDRALRAECERSDRHDFMERDRTHIRLAQSGVHRIGEPSGNRIEG